MSTPHAPEIQIAAEVTRRIRQHARTSMTTEVCGVLIGALREGEGDHAVNIFASIAAVNATQAGTHVTFTQDAWEHIYKVKDAEYPDERIVGWYHSHPGFGVFLSEHDTFIQENFFSAANQVAWVFDPHTDEEGCFGWVDGTITRLASMHVLDQDTPANIAESRDLTRTDSVADADAEAYDAAPAKRSPRWLRWTATTASLLAALVLGFALSHLLFPTPYPLILMVNPVTSQPLIRDPKTSAPIFLDETGRSVEIDPHTGKLTFIDRSSLHSMMQQASPQPAPAPQPATPPATKETK